MATPAAAAHAAHEHHEPQSFWRKYVFSLDHKVIGIQYTVTALAVGAIGLVLSWLMRLQLGFPGAVGAVNPTNYYQFMTYHGLIMVVYLQTAILLGGFGNYLIPLMIGARDMAYPTLNMLSYWTYLLSVILLLAGYFVPGGPSGGSWVLYPPQSITAGTPGSGLGITLLLASIAVFVVSATMGGLNYITTVLQMRTRGMTLMRMPLTVWGVFISAVVALLSFPPLFVAGVMLLFDHLLGTSFFIPTVNVLGTVLPHEGGSPLLFQHLFWFFGHPEVYVVILPAMGIISDVMATHARKPIFGYKAMIVSMAAIGVISFIVWAHHMFASGMNPFFGYIFAATTLVVAIPSAMKTYNWLLTLWKGSIRFTTPMLFTIGFVSTFVIGGLTGLFLGNVAVDLPLHDTYFVVGHFHLVMGVSAILAMFAGIYHWFPKVTGRMMNETLGKIHFFVTFLGAYLVFFPMFLMGFQGIPRRYFSFDLVAFAPSGLDAVNAMVTVAALAVGAAQLVFVANIVWSAVRGREADANPWQANTLEWQTPQIRPGHGNWGPKLPEVYRWPYDYSVPGAARDFIPQNEPEVAVVSPAAGPEPEGAGR
ncbi:MAG: cbb3-type cytochrome c oxidase subunit I [Bacillota bacterium]|nr:cytochrome c oxidase subunit I [Bacillota bacterium]